jgi:nucleolin
MDGKKRKRDSSSEPGSASGSSSSAPGAGASAAGPATLGVFCSGLPYDGTEADIRKFFQGCGEIVDVRAPTYHDTGRLRGYAHVDFATLAAAAAALKLDGKYLRDRFVNVEPAKPPGGGAAERAGSRAVTTRPKGCTTLFVKGLPYDMDENGVKEEMGKFGAILSVRIARWNNTTNSKGFGYVQYEHGFAAEAAMKAFRSGGGVSVGGRSVSLDWDAGAPKASFRLADKQFFAKTDEGHRVNAASKAAQGWKEGSGGGKKGGFRDAGIAGADGGDGGPSGAGAGEKHGHHKHHHKGGRDEERRGGGGGRGGGDDSDRAAKKPRGGREDKEGRSGGGGGGGGFSSGPKGGHGGGNPFKKQAVPKLHMHDDE